MKTPITMVAVLFASVCIAPAALATAAVGSATAASAALAREQATLAEQKADMARQRAERKEKRADMAHTRQQLDQLRERMDMLARRLADLSRKAGEPAPQAFAYRFLADPDAGMLGLVLTPHKDSLEVAAVTPGSPAEDAGIVTGDRIVSVDGNKVSTDGVANIGGLDEVKAGQIYKLGVEHQGSIKILGIKAERRTMPAWSSLLNENHVWHSKELSHIDIQRIVRQANDGARQARIALHSFAPWWGLNLVSLNKDLGSYFGTDKGALLLSSDGDSLPGLKAGDVITKIGATRIDRPEDAMRALRENAGDKIRASIVRHGKHMQVAVQLPEHQFVLPPAPPKPPEPPTVPKPPHMTPPSPPAPPTAPKPEHNAAP